MTTQNLEDLDSGNPAAGQSSSPEGTAPPPPSPGAGADSPDKPPGDNADAEAEKTLVAAERIRAALKAADAAEAAKAPPSPLILFINDYVEPTNYAEALALHLKLEATPALTKEEGELKEEALKDIKALVYSLQQGNPIIQLDAGQIHALSKQHDKVTREQRWEFFSRSHPVAAEMLQEITALRKALTATQTALNALKKKK